MKPSIAIGGGSFGNQQGTRGIQQVAYDGSDFLGWQSLGDPSTALKLGISGGGTQNRVGIGFRSADSQKTIKNLEFPREPAMALSQKWSRPKKENPKTVSSPDLAFWVAKIGQSHRFF